MIPRGTLSLEGAGGYRRQFFQSESLGLSFYANGTVTFAYQLFERLSASTLGSYFRDEYQESTPKRVDENWLAEGSLTYLFTSWLQGSLTYEYRQRTSNLGLDEFVDNRVFFVLTATYFDKPRPL